MTRHFWSTVGIAAGVSALVCGNAWAQAKSENAKTERQWSLKSGPGAPHNILPVGDISRTNESLFLRVPKLSADYVLGDGDRLNIVIVNGGPLNEPLSSLTISNAGMITIPYIGNVRASGLTTGQLEEHIKQLFVERQLIKQPDVLVYITDYKAKPFFVMGEVDNPGEYMMSQEMTLMEAILLAGGIDPTAGSDAYLYRRPSPSPDDPPLTVPLDPETPQPGVEITKIDIRPLKLGGVPDPDIPIRKGDLLLIPKGRDMRFFVIGDVRAPGPLTIPPPVERVMFASQAIAQAGGPNRTAKLSEGVLVRYNEQGQREEKKVDFMAILKGRQPDVEIRANDIIFIPSSNAKLTAYGLLGTLPQAVEQTGREQATGR